ncbi:methylmalonyl-CoA mutase family protein [Streptomyces fuscichromogenes]|uniref:methylmalonyl-CoA mutase family protein n=1 Tax=Streptomyces fuscichromogenes TaxID=1324013 RepID=UPI0037FD9486
MVGWLVVAGSRVVVSGVRGSRRSAVEANAVLRRAAGRGVRDLAVVFDAPTGCGCGSDLPGVGRGVGVGGVAVDSIDDMRVLFAGVSFGRVSTVLAADAVAAPLLLLYQLVAEERGVPARWLAGGVGNDPLRGFVVRGVGLFPPGLSVRLAGDVLCYCAAELPRWVSAGLSGCELAGAGASAAQEVAFTAADGLAYVRAAVAGGLDAGVAVSRLSFVFAAGATVVEGAAKVLAARRVWARLVAREFGERVAVSCGARFGTCSLGAGGGWGVSRAVLRVRSAVGLCAVERLAGEVAGAAFGLVERVEQAGGVWGAAGGGFRGAGRARGGRGYGCGRGAGGGVGQVERLAKVRAWRCGERVAGALRAVGVVAEGGGNVLFPMKEALAAGATVGEVCGVLRGVWGSGGAECGWCGTGDGVGCGGF